MPLSQTATDDDDNDDECLWSHKNLIHVYAPAAETNREQIAVIPHWIFFTAHAYGTDESCCAKESVIGRVPRGQDISRVDGEFRDDKPQACMQSSS